MAGKPEDKKFDSKKTVKVSGVSQLLRDLIEKELQAENSTGYREDVSKLHVCPNGQDYVLVEYVKDIPGTSTIGHTLKVGGTELSVEQWKPQTTSTEALGSNSVSKIWLPDGSTVSHDDYEVVTYNEEGTERKNDPGNTGRKSFGKDARHDKFNKNRRDLNSVQEITPPYSEAPFSEAKVKLRDNFTEKVKKTPEFKKILKEENVKMERSYLTGTWNAICTAGQKLLSFISLSDQNGNNDDPVKGRAYGALTASPQTSDKSTQSVEPPQELFAVNTLFLRYILAYHYGVYQKLENVSQEIRFDVKSKTERNMHIIANEDVDKKKFSKTMDDFVEFYQDQNQKMHQEKFPMPPKDKTDIISETRAKFSVVIDSSQERDKITIYGEKNKVEEAKSFLKSKVDSLDSGSGSTKKVSAKDALTEKLSCDLSTNMKLVVYQGDLTKENVDAIVNPANDHLQHGGGAAGAILKAGGRSIQDDSDAIMRKRNHHPLQPGDVEATAGGKLPCKFVVHAVGPVWNHHPPNTAMQLLYNAVNNSLCLASRNGAKSISIPAIGSGLYKVPVDTCAKVLFDAAANFTVAANNLSTIKEIRFVNIDSKTNRTFSQEMEKRFHRVMKREKIEAITSKATEDQGRQRQVEQQQNALTTTSTSRRDHTTSPSGNRNHQDGDSGSKGGSNSSNQPPKPLLSYAGAAVGGKPAASPTHDSKPDDAGKTLKDGECSICLCKFKKKKTLDKCGHSFCTECINKEFKQQKKCPICGHVYGPLTGNQPPGKMYDSFQSTSLPSFGRGTIVISYRFSSGTQGPDHPNPGKPYTGTSRTAYLPDNKDGRKVLKLLKKAFEQKLTFTIGRSTTTGWDDYVTWNGIHHKTSTFGGPTSFGYPDPDYLKRVQDELAAKGITE